MSFGIELMGSGVSSSSRFNILASIPFVSFPPDSDLTAPVPTPLAWACKDAYLNCRCSSSLLRSGARRQDFLGPGGFVIGQRRMGRFFVTNLSGKVSALVALIHQTLQVERHIGIAPSQGDADQG